MNKITDALITPIIIFIGTILGIAAILSPSIIAKIVGGLMIYVIYINPVLYQICKSRGCYD